MRGLKELCSVALGCATLVSCTKPASQAPNSARRPWTIPHVLRIGMLSDPDNLNPYLSDQASSSDVASLVYSFLIVADSNGHMSGDLATEVPSLANGGISLDGRTYVYHLRHNALWQDGAQFTARDVIASWRAVMNPRNNTLGRDGYDQVTKIDARDPYTAVVHLRKRYPPFVSLFFTSLEDLSKPVLPAHLIGRDGAFANVGLSRWPIGTGPFRFVSWARSDRIIFTRFNDYFAGTPKLTRIEMRFMPSAQTMLVALQQHQLDLVPTPQAVFLRQYFAIDGIRVVTFRANGEQYLIINASKPGLDEVAVRRALAISVPYDDLLHKVAHNVLVRARNVLPATALGYEALPLRNYDPSTASRILERAGWRLGPDGVRARRGTRLAFTLITISGLASLERSVLLMQAAMKPVGIQLSIKTYPGTVFAAPSGPIYSGTFDLAYSGHSLNWDPDLYDQLACDRWYPRGQNFYRFCDPQLDVLERSGLQTDDPIERAAIYRKASRLIWSEVPYVSVYGGRSVDLRSTDLHGYSIGPAGIWQHAWRWDI